MKENKLIAEFMGVPYKDGDVKLTQNHWPRSYWRTAAYHTSFDWLMPVVEKINTTIIDGERIDVIIYRMTCHINNPEQIIVEATGKDMLTCTYKAVVEFIKLYNTTKQQEHNHEST